MIEEATTGILDFAAIPAAFQNHVADGLDALIETVNETSPRVDQFLSNGTTQVCFPSVAAKIFRRLGTIFNQL